MILGIFIPSNISNLAFNMFSLEPKFPICEVPIFVITANVGFAILVKRLISPKWFIPISTTKASCSFNFSIVNGNPILLLLFPSVFKVLYFIFTTFAIISFVLVFPTLPVIAITGILYKLLLYLAISYNAFKVFSTFIIVLFEYFSISFLLISIFSIITASAPLSNACFQNLLPSNFSPFIPM